MRKSLKLVAATIAVSASSLAVKSADAQDVSDNLALEPWIERTVVDVKDAITKEIEETGKYTIQWGDTLSVIAEAIGLSVDEITILNEIQNPDLIVSGSALSFDEENHQITFENEETGESVTYSTETGEVQEPVALEAASTDGVILAEVDEWVQEEAVSDEIISQEAVVDTTPVSEPIASDAEVEWLVSEEPTAQEDVESTEEPVSELEEAVTVPDTSWEVVEEEQTTPVESIPEETEEVAEEPVVDVPAEEETPVAEPELDYYLTDLAAMPENANLSSSELAAKYAIRGIESGHNYDIYSPSGNHYGAYQMLDSYFSTYGYGNTSPASQEAAANGYVAERYGTWQNALAFHNANGWY